MIDVDALLAYIEKQQQGYLNLRKNELDFGYKNVWAEGESALGTVKHWIERNRNDGQTTAPRNADGVSRNS